MDERLATYSVDLFIVFLIILILSLLLLSVRPERGRTPPFSLINGSFWGLCAYLRTKGVAVIVKHLCDFGLSK